MHLTSGVAMEDKTPIYSVMGSPGLVGYHRTSSTSGSGRNCCMSWTSVMLSAMALVGTCLALLVAVQQGNRVEDLEVRLYQGDERITFLEAKLDALAQLHIGGDLDYLDDHMAADQGLAPENEEELLVRELLQRKKRSIPVYEQSYGVDFTKIHSKAVSDKLRLYDTLSQSAEDWTLPATTEDPIKPHHRVSSTWTSGQPKTSFEKEQVRRSQALRNKVSKKRPPPAHLESRASRVKKFPFDLVKSLDGQGPHAKNLPDMSFPDSSSPFLLSDPEPEQPVLYRNSFTKATASANPPAAPSRLLNSVTLEPVPQLVRQGPLDLNTFSKKNLGAYSSVPMTTYTTRAAAAKRKNRRHTRRSRGRSQLTVAHFIASNNTMEDNSLVHRSWSPAPWMDKLGLNKKYKLNLGTVTVKEPGLYFIYAQVLYTNGRYGTGYQIVVDGIPVMECNLAPLEPTNSCHTSGVTYLPRNAAIVVRDMERYMTPIIREEASFFGLVKLLDAPASPEALILG